MNSLNFFQTIKKNLVKCFIMLFLGFILHTNSYANPIIPGPMIFEIYFGPEGWQIEMMNTMYGGDNLDNVWMTSMDDAAHFKPGISFGYDEVIVVTQEDFMSEFNINQAGDWLTLIYIDGEITSQIDFYGLAWGEFNGEYPPYNFVTPPVGEQSIALQEIYFTPYSDWYWAVKEQPNTLGADPGDVHKRAAFSGYVRDGNDEPLADIELDYCGTVWSPPVPVIYTDSSGYFHSEDMFCMTDHILFKYNGGIIGDSTVSIEPDSANYYEFKLDTLLTRINDYNPVIPGYSIYTIPNPSSTLTKFIIETTNPIPDQKAIIKIYSEAGFIVDILPVVISEDKQEISYNFKDKSLNSGLYLYNLEIRNRKVASGKMIVSQ